jgi:hypothetical protein
MSDPNLDNMDWSLELAVDNRLTLQQRLVEKVLYNHKFLDFGPPPPRSLLTLVPARRWSTRSLYAAGVALLFAVGALITTLALVGFKPS